jgi:hypothetical protein
MWVNCPLKYVNLKLREETKMKKKLISLVLVAIMLVAFTVPAMASGADVLDAKMRELAARYSDNAAAQSAISEARSWLAVPANAATISAADATAIAGNIDAAVAAAGTGTHLSDMTQAQQNQIMASINAAAGVLDWTVSVGTTGIIRILDANGELISAIAVGDAIKQTGIDSGLLIVIIAGITLLFGAATVVAVISRKKKILTEA